MDRDRFDALTRAFATSANRRSVLKGFFAGTAVAATSGMLVQAHAGAQDTCAAFAEACENVEGSCCEPYTCFEGQCDLPKGCVSEGLPCVDEFPCCEDEGLSCVEGVCAASTGTCAGSGEPCEMVEGSCCAPYTCFEAICDIPRGCVGEGLPCVDDFPCCDDEGLTCLDGVCAVATCGEVGTLPTLEPAIHEGLAPGWCGGGRRRCPLAASVVL